MQDRRRFARFLGLAIAALAVAGTSRAIPTVEPQHVATTGTIHLTAEEPVGIQAIEVVPESGQLGRLAFTASPNIDPTVAKVGATVIQLDAPMFHLAPTPVHMGNVEAVEFDAGCASQPCARRFALLFTWLNPTAGGAVDVPWTLATTASFVANYDSASPPPARISVTAVARELERGKPVAVGAEAPIHVTEADRYRAWDVTLHRDPAVNATGAATLGILRTTATQTAGPAWANDTRTDHRITDRSDPPIQVRIARPDGSAWSSWTPAGPVLLDLFTGCAAMAACEETLTIEIAWADGRPDTAFDVDWNLDVQSLSTAGEPGGVTASADELTTPELVTASASGSFESSGDTIRGSSTIVASLKPVVLDLGRWPIAIAPTRGLATARVTSIGTTPWPDDAEITIGIDSQPPSTTGAVSSVRVGVRLGERGSFAFEPNLACAADGRSGCAFRGTIGTFVESPYGTGATGFAVRVDWTIELGIAVSPGGSLTLDVDPSGTAQPSTVP